MATSRGTRSCNHGNDHLDGKPMTLMCSEMMTITEASELERFDVTKADWKTSFQRLTFVCLSHIESIACVNRKQMEGSWAT